MAMPDAGKDAEKQNPSRGCWWECETPWALRQVSGSSGTWYLPRCPDVSPLALTPKKWGRQEAFVVRTSVIGPVWPKLGGDGQDFDQVILESCGAGPAV